MRGQLHAPAAPYPRERPGTHTDTFTRIIIIIIIIISQVPLFVLLCL